MNSGNDSIDSEQFRRYLQDLGSDIQPGAGFFSPETVFWRVSREPALLLAGMRALLLQIAHPKVAQGVADHSRYREDPLGRGIRTFTAVYSLVFGRREEAIEAAPAFAPDLVILDVMMPGMDGPDTMEALRKLPVTADVDMIFMTAKVQSHEVERYRGMGAVDVIAKPFDPMTLASQVQAVWDRQQAEPGTAA